MTVEELKSEAKKLGYKLIKDVRPPKLLPCICGCNKRAEWWDSVHCWVELECRRCGLIAIGKDRTEAIRVWNSMVTERKNDMS